MYHKGILTIIFTALLNLFLFAQDDKSVAEADARSLELYNNAQWKQLVAYGNEQLAAGVDFPLLRMRIGYASFITGNYSRSLLHYKTVWDADKSNMIALYYVYLNNLYLNNTIAARYYAAKLPPETKVSENITAFRISGVDGEFSYKSTDIQSRDDATYVRAGLSIQAGYRLELHQSAALFSQKLSEPALTGVSNNLHISNNQKEYYARLSYAATGKLSILGGYHYLYTPFNNLVYNNHIGFGGIQYTSPFAHVKLMASAGNISNISYSQFDVTLSLFPLGNTKLYTVSRVAYGNELTYSQVVGYRIARPLWLEGNITLGKYDILLEKDALYVYNDIDQKQFKAGGSLYLILSKKGLWSVNYTFDKKLRFNTINNHFFQHSLNTAITWKF